MNHLEESSRGCSRFPPIGPEDTDACRHLWLTVLKQQVEDATSVSDKSRMRGIKARAKAWLADHNHDSGYSEVCYLAGLDPVKARFEIKKMLHDPANKTSFRGIPKSCSKTGTIKPRKHRKPSSAKATTNFSQVQRLSVGSRTA